MAGSRRGEQDMREEDIDVRERGGGSLETGPPPSGQLNGRRRACLQARGEGGRGEPVVNRREEEYRSGEKEGALALRHHNYFKYRTRRVQWLSKHWCTCVSLDKLRVYTTDREQLGTRKRQAEATKAS